MMLQILVYMGEGWPRGEPKEFESPYLPLKWTLSEARGWSLYVSAFLGKPQSP